MRQNIISRGITNQFNPRDSQRKINPFDSKGFTIYTPPTPKKTPELTQQFLDWLNNPETKMLHPILISAISHHHLVSIHPFSDGNGRTSRALSLWILYQNGFDPNHVLALDEYYAINRQRYYTMLQQARELDHDLTYWIEYVATGLLDILTKTKQRIESLQLMSQTKIKLNRQQEALLRYIRYHPQVRSPELENAFKISRARISQLLKPLTEARLIQKNGLTRATSYQLVPLPTD